VAAARLVADLEAVGPAGQDAQQILEAAHLGAMDHLALLVEGADRDALGVDIETDVKHKAPPEVEKRQSQYLLPRYPTDRGFLHSFTPPSAAAAPPGSHTRPNNHKKRRT